MKNSFEKLAGKNILVAGGLGFIGSNLVHRLAKISGVKTTIIDSLGHGMGGNRFNLNGLLHPVETCIADMTDQLRMNDLVRDSDYIFNLVGKVSHIDSMTDPLTDMRSNYLSHLSLLEACKLHNPSVKIIYTSTRQVYGRANLLPIPENHPTNPVDVNGIHKLAAERLHQLYNRVYDIRSVVLRLSNTYGPRMPLTHPRHGFIGWFVRKAIEGAEIELFGDGKQLRGLTHVDDIVEAILLAATIDETDGGVFNLGSSRIFTLEYVAQVLIELTGKGTYRHIDFPEHRKRIDIGNSQLDFSAFHKLSGWEPSISLKDGLRQTIQYYEQHVGWYLEQNEKSF